MNLTIEQMREIVDGAPDKTADHYAIGDWGDAYFSLEFGSVWCAEEKDWFDSDYSTLEELGCDYKFAIPLDNLRAAIADHDTKPCLHGYDIACLICRFGTKDGKIVWSNQKNRSAFEDDRTDHVSDIRNHIAPTTRVIER